MINSGGKMVGGPIGSPLQNSLQQHRPRVRAIWVTGLTTVRQRRVGHRGHRGIVITHQRDIAGHRTAGRLEHLQRADRHQVVGHEDGVQIGEPVQQSLRRRRRHLAW